jgi:hypothetical protein
MDTVVIPEENLMVVGTDGYNYYIADVSKPLTSENLLWQWNGRKLSDGRWGAIWSKWIPQVREIKPPEPLSKCNIPYPRELKIWHG